MSDPKSILLAALDTVQAGRFSYFLYGGIAAGLWGHPRYTEDVDFVLFLPEREMVRFLREASKHGFAVDEDLAIQQIQVSGWARLPFGDPKSPWHLDLTLGDSPFDESALERRRTATFFGRRVRVASPEDIVIYKLISNRPRDQLDLKRIAERQKDDLDRAYLRKWVDWWEKQGIRGIRSRYDDLISK